MIFGRRRTKEKPKKLGIIDYTLFAAILFFAVYFGIQYLFFDYGANNSTVHVPDREPFWTVLRFFKIKTFDAIAIIAVVAFLMYRKHKRKSEDDES